MPLKFRELIDVFAQVHLTRVVVGWEDNANLAPFFFLVCS